MSLENKENSFISNKPWENLFIVEPSSFELEFELNKEEYLRLNIKNILTNPNELIAWKLKTNRPGRYMVSPKQGLIKYNNTQTCTVVLTKLKDIPNTTKPDKFLIQATKIINNNTVNDGNLSLLWKERESKHNKHNNVFTYQAITIKTYLKYRNANKIETIGGSTNNLDVDNNDDDIRLNRPSIFEDNHNDTGNDNSVNNNELSNTNNNNNNNGLYLGKYNEDDIKKWKNKFDEFPELFKFTTKTLKEKDELQTQNNKYQIELEQLRELINDLKKEKQQILLNKVNNFNNNNDNIMDSKDDIQQNELKSNNIDNDNDIHYDHDTFPTPNNIKNEFNNKMKNNNNNGYHISVLQIFIMLIVAFISFKMGGFAQSFEQRNNQTQIINENTPETPKINKDL